MSKNRVNALDMAAILVAFAFPAIFIPTATASPETPVTVQEATAQHAQNSFEAAVAFEETAIDSPLKFTITVPATEDAARIEWTAYVNPDGSIPSSIGSGQYPYRSATSVTGEVVSEMCVSFDPIAGGECYTQGTLFYPLAPMQIGPWEAAPAPTTTPFTDRPDGVSVATANIIGANVGEYEVTATESTFTITSWNAATPDADPQVMTWQIVDPSEVPAMPTAPIVQPLAE